MTKKFNFLHNGLVYEVIGSYGQNNSFLVTPFSQRTESVPDVAGSATVLPFKLW
jgi:hypothetical protein